MSAPTFRRMRLFAPGVGVRVLADAFDVVVASGPEAFVAEGPGAPGGALLARRFAVRVGEVDGIAVLEADARDEDARAVLASATREVSARLLGKTALVDEGRFELLYDEYDGGHQLLAWSDGDTHAKLFAAGVVPPPSELAALPALLEAARGAGRPIEEHLLATRIGFRRALRDEATDMPIVYARELRVYARAVVDPWADAPEAGAGLHRAADEAYARAVHAASVDDELFVVPGLFGLRSLGGIVRARVAASLRVAAASDGEPSHVDVVRRALALGDVRIGSFVLLARSGESGAWTLHHATREPHLQTMPARAFALTDAQLVAALCGDRFGSMVRTVEFSRVVAAAARCSYAARIEACEEVARTGIVPVDVPGASWQEARVETDTLVRAFEAHATGAA